jgi:alkylation response protein AidB-like acyl-CoA dehydrogenase
VNGVKKWITQGYSADYFTTAVRTGGPGLSGISLLLIERVEGVDTKKIKTSYSAAAGTSYITFENVKVPVQNLIGKENEGFKYIMSNFNHERWSVVCVTNTYARRITEECFKWAHQRKVFGKPLIEQPVIRQKLAHMISRVEAVESWLESITYQMQNSKDDQKLAGPIALLKQLCTQVTYDVSDNACQIFGGRAITRTGMGQLVERIQRSIKFGAILGGSEEIMADLAIRMAMRNFPKTAKL